MSGSPIPDNQALHEKIREAAILTESALAEIGAHMVPMGHSYFQGCDKGADVLMQALRVTYLSLRIPFREATKDEYDEWLDGEWFDYLQEHGNPLMEVPA